MLPVYGRCSCWAWWNGRDLLDLLAWSPWKEAGRAGMGVWYLVSSLTYRQNSVTVGFSYRSIHGFHQILKELP